FNGQAIRMDYDGVGRILARVYPDGTSNSFGYTVTGQRWRMVDGSGETTNTFDARDRIIQRDHITLGGPNSRVNYWYNPQGTASRVQGSDPLIGPTSDTSYVYDSLNRLVAVGDTSVGSYPDRATAYEYDLAGNLEV